MALLDGLYPSHDALVAMGASELLQLVVIAFNDAQARFLHFGEELLHALIAPAGIDMKLFDRFRRHLQAHRDGVKAK